MRETLRLAMALAVGLALCNSAWAATQFVSFDNFGPLNSPYGNWGDGNVTTVTPGATSLGIESLGFGGNYRDIIPNVDASGETTVQLDVTVNSTALGNVGFLVALGDADGSEHRYAWFGNVVGNHVLTLPVSTPFDVPIPGGVAGLDVSALDYLHIQVDAGGNFAYDVSWNDLSLVGAAVPEPASLALAVCGAIGLLAVRRKYS